MKISKKSLIILISLSIVLFVYATIIVNSLINGNGKLGFFSYEFCTVLSNVDEVNVRKGDLIIVKQIETKDIVSGDKIVYEKDDDVIIKIVKEVNDDGKNIVVQGEDFSNDENNEQSKILGKMTGKISRIGNLARILQTPAGTLILLSIFICIILIVKKLYNK